MPDPDRQAAPEPGPSTAARVLAALLGVALLAGVTWFDVAVAHQNLRRSLVATTLIALAVVTGTIRRWRQRRRAGDAGGPGTPRR